MLYIVLTVIISISLLLVFKGFQRCNVNTLVAIVINYLVAGITGIVFLNSDFKIGVVLNCNWVFVCLPLGLLFISIFYLISQTTQKISISTASVANKMSVIMPVLFSVLFLKQELSFFKSLGIVLAMVAVYLSTRPNRTQKLDTKLIWLPILVFIGSGLIDITINAVNEFYIKTNQESALFSICTFFSAFIIGSGILFYQLLVKKSLSMKEITAPKNIIGGLVLGIPNYFSIYFIFKSLEANVFQSSQLFPILNLSNVVLSAFLAWLVFKERLSLLNIVGIFLGVLAIISISI